jgi:predicted MFS family arabinose efflux permease
LFTYVRPFLETVAHADASALALILLGMGVAGFIGTVAIGVFLKRGIYRTLIAIPVFMAAVAAALLVWGSWLWPVAALLALWGLLSTAAPVGWWSWLAQTVPEEAEAGGGLMVAVVQCAIALGSTVGGMLFDSRGYKSTFVASAAVLVVAALLAFMTAGQRRGKPR